MARVDLAPQQITRDGLTPAMTAPIVDGDVIDPGAVFLMVTATTAAVTVTVQSPVTVDGLDVEELIVTVPVSTTTLIGPLPQRLFGRKPADVDAGRTYVDYSALTGVTRALISF